MGDLLAAAIVAGLFSIVAYFLNRLITQYDEFRKETRTSLGKIEGRLGEVEQTATQAYNLTYTKLREPPVTGTRRKTYGSTGIDQETKAQISKIESKVTKIQKDMEETVKPSLAKVSENTGKIIWIQENIKQQDLKVLTLFKAVKKIADNDKPKAPKKP